MGGYKRVFYCERHEITIGGTISESMIVIPEITILLEPFASFAGTRSWQIYNSDSHEYCKKFYL